MGTRVAPTFVNLVIAYLEVPMYDLWTEIWKQLPKILTVSKCYLGYYFIMWLYDFEQLSKFKNKINNINHRIQFTFEYNHKQLPFLDLLIIKSSTEI